MTAVVTTEPCALCRREVPDGCAGYASATVVLCVVCLWDGATPGWLAHEEDAHDEPYSTCTACEQPARPGQEVKF